MNMCQELDIDPESDAVLFCLAADLGSKALGEFAKEPFVSGWLAIDSRCVTIPSRTDEAALTRWPR